MGVSPKIEKGGIQVLQDLEIHGGEAIQQKIEVL